MCRLTYLRNTLGSSVYIYFVKFSSNVRGIRTLENEIAQFHLLRDVKKLPGKESDPLIFVGRLYVQCGRCGPTQKRKKKYKESL